MRIGLVRTQVPFVTGGAERHAANLAAALQRHGHEATEITLPFKWYPGDVVVDNILSARLTDLSEVEGVPIDLMIGLKFPAWLARHPNKLFWIIHQYRQAYDMWDAGTSDLLHDPQGAAIRQLVHAEDLAALKSSPHPIYANSANVAARLQNHLGLTSKALYHPPPMADHMREGAYGDYIFAPGRINPSKRLDLVIDAFARTKAPLRLVIAGSPENPAYLEDLQKQALTLGVSNRITWLGAIDDATMIDHYANARAVVFVPRDEDYGYVTLEAMLSGKPVLTVTDAGGPLEFIRHGQEGLISAPTPDALADSFEHVLQDCKAAEQMGQAGKARYDAMQISWDHVVETFTGQSTPQDALRPAKAPDPAPEPAEPPVSEPDIALEALRVAIAPDPKVALPFASMAEVMESFDFDTLPRPEGTPPPPADPGLVSYLDTHWTRFLTTLDLVTDVDPKSVLDVGVFPPLAFEAMLKTALPEVTIDGVWEGPDPYAQEVRSRKPDLPDFNLMLRPANIERDPLPYGDDQYDMVLGMEIFEHLALDPYFFLCQAARVLRPGGHILLSTPNVVSHRGVGKALQGLSPYSFGLFVPTGGVYGRHNREYTPHEVEALAKTAGFETTVLKTVDVYDQHMDPATAAMLHQRGDDLRLRGETIFYVGRKTGAPTAPPPGVYHGDPRRMSGQLAVAEREEVTGLVRLSATNLSSDWWLAGGTSLLAEWRNGDGTLVHTNVFVPLGDAVAPGDTRDIPLRLDPDGADDGGTLKLHLFQTGVGYLTGTGRANMLELPCSEDAFVRLARLHD